MSTIRTRITTALVATGLTAALAACGTVSAQPQPAAEPPAPAAPAPGQPRGVQYADSDIILKQKVSELRRSRLDPGCEPATLDRVISDHVREQLQQQCEEDAALHDRWNEPRKGGGVPTFE